MLIGDMDISRLMVYVQQIYKEKFMDREEYRNKKSKTRNESGQQKDGCNRPHFKKSKGPSPAFASAPAPETKVSIVAKIHKITVRPAESQKRVARGVVGLLYVPSMVKPTKLNVMMD